MAGFWLTKSPEKQVGYHRNMLHFKNVILVIVITILVNKEPIPIRFFHLIFPRLLL